ncbi:MAG: LysR family transcriptional regulator [Gammaproteobacteria bacterium]|nr:LysR family transcriptional regulator [Gammaproteobacteria bacterium]
MSELQEMRTFTRAVEVGGFSAAARELDLSPSAVSKLVSRLEDRLGARLLHRTTRRLSPTEEGRAFYHRCVAILGEIQQAEEAVSEARGRVRGTLRVVAMSAFGRAHLLPLLPEFMSRFPELRLELQLRERTVDLVDEGIDVALQLSETVTDESLVARKLFTNRRIVCAAPAYLERYGTPRVPEDLMKHNCLTHSSFAHFNDWEFTDRSGTRILHVGGNFEANSASSLYRAVVAGVGIARLATFLVGRDLKKGRLLPLLTDYTHDQSSLLVVYPHRRHLSQKVRAFVDFVAGEFTPVPPWERD